MAATPLHWEEVEALDDPAELNFRTVPERLSTLAADPWGGMADATPIRPLAGEPWWLADDGTRYTRADLIGA